MKPALSHDSHTNAPRGHDLALLAALMAIPGLLTGCILLGDEPRQATANDFVLDMHLSDDSASDWEALNASISMKSIANEPVVVHRTFEDDLDAFEYRLITPKGALITGAPRISSSVYGSMTSVWPVGETRWTNLTFEALWFYSESRYEFDQSGEHQFQVVTKSYNLEGPWRAFVMETPS